jgi:hypothetical protein
MSRAFTVENAALSILLVGDWGRDGHCCQNDVAQEMALASAKVQAEWIVSTGDNFYPSGLQFQGDPQVNSSFLEVYIDPHPDLQKPWPSGALMAALGPVR